MDKVQLFIEGKQFKETRDRSHYITHCPFCDKPYHLYINRESGAWDCKKCGESGSLKKLLQHEGIPFNLPDLTDQALKYHKYMVSYVPDIKNILIERGLERMIEKRKYGYCNDKGRISIPYWKNGKVVQMRYRAVNGNQSPKYLSDTGSQAMLYNSDDLFDFKKNQAILCEGEFDTDICSDRMPDWAVVGIPGANNFKPYWGRYFNRFKRVLICLDAGDAGYAGALKVKKFIPHAEIIKFPEGLPNNFDMTDYFLSEKELPSIEEMVESEIGDLIPKGGFIKDYMDYCRPLTDAPDAFHLFNALGILSTCIGRKAYIISFGGHALYPNLWIVLLAPSSFYRKSTALNISKTLISQIEALTIYPSEFSREALQESIAEKPQGVFVWYELGGILGLLNRDYMVGTKDFLADIYDCLSDTTRKLKGKEHTIKDSYINIMSATNLDWLTEKIKKQDIRSGFLARFLYIPVDKKERFIAIPADPDMKLKNNLLRFMNNLTKLKSIEFKNKHLKSDFTDFAKATEKEIIGTKHEAILAPFFSRLEAYLWKFAMLFELSIGNKGPEISHEAFYWAVNVVDFLKTKLKAVIGEGFEIEGDPKLKRVLKVIKDNSRLTKREILQKTGYLARDVSELINTLTISGQVIKKPEGKTERYFYV